MLSAFAGNILSLTGSMDSTVGIVNPIRYRSYYYDRETGFYYLQSRYYDPDVGRFINADGVIGNNLEGFNLFTYCNNNPVNNVDPSGYWLETALDVISLASSIDDMYTDPSWENAGWLALDIFCCIVPVATGSYAIKSAKRSMDLIDAGTDVIKSAGKIGDNLVYLSKNADDVTQYVGITSDFARRQAEHFARKGIVIEPLMKNLSRADARSVEQALIKIHGLGKNGGTLLNKINSISQMNPIYTESLELGYELLKSIGYI